MVNKVKHVPFSYLDRQFSHIDTILKGIKTLVRSGDFTLGRPLVEFERRFAAMCGMPHAIGVGSGTDALILSLKMLGVGPGDEVITTPMTFIATVGAISMTGARPVFVDSEDGYVIDHQKIEAAITNRTKAILPVHYTGNVPEMDAILRIAKEHKLAVVEDACQSIMAALNGKMVGSWGETACFSLHPLKNLNVWGDGGVIVTRSESLATRLCLFRNHGLSDRDNVLIFGCNSRLDTMQAVVGNHLIKDVDWITKRRIKNAQRYDKAFSELPEFIRVPRRRPGVKHVYHLYVLRVQKRDQLLTYLNKKGIEAKIHYPIPVHLQPAAAHLGHKTGDFPICEEDCRQIITLPAHQHLTDTEIDYTIEQVNKFYRKKI